MNYGINSQSRDNSRLFARHQLYVRYWANYIHVLVRTNVTILATGSVLQGPPQRRAWADHMTLTLNHTLLAQGGHKPRGPVRVFSHHVGADWEGWTASSDCPWTFRYHKGNMALMRADA